MLEGSTVICTLYCKAIDQIDFDPLPYMPSSNNPEGNECGRFGVEGEILVLYTQGFPSYLRNHRFSEHFIFGYIYIQFGPIQNLVLSKGLRKA